MAPGSACVGSEPPSGRVPGSSARLISGRFIVRFRFRSATGSSCPAVILPRTLAGADRRQEGNPLLSFLDEPDEPARSRRRPPRGPSTDRQTLMLRRTIALVGGVIVLILLVLGVRGCLNARQEQRDRGLRERLGRAAARVQGGGRPALRAAPGRGRRRPGHRDHQPAQRLPRRVRPRASTAPSALDVPGDLDERAGRAARGARAAPRRAAPRSPTRCAWRSATRTGARAPTTSPSQMQVFLASDVIDTLRFRPQLFDVLRDEELSAPDLPAQRLRARHRVAPARLRRRPGQRAAHRHRRHRRRRRARPARQRPRRPSRSAGSRSRRASRRRSSCPIDLAFEIQVQNQGENTENDVVVRVTVGDGSDARSSPRRRSTRSRRARSRRSRSRSPSSRPPGRTCRSRSRSSRCPASRRPTTTRRSPRSSSPGESRPSGSVTWPRGRSDHHPGHRRARRRGRGSRRAAVGDRARRQAAPAARRPAHGAGRASQADLVAHAAADPGGLRPAARLGRGDRRPAGGADGHGRAAHRRLRRLHVAGPLRRLGRDVRPAVEHDGAARRRAAPASSSRRSCTATRRACT